MLVKLKARPFNILIVQTYAPTKEYPEEEVEAYYEKLQKVLKSNLQRFL